MDGIARESHPFAFSDSSALTAVSDRLVNAKPDVHKKTFLKRFHRSAEFCSTCHKVSLPVELSHYKDFLRGRSHYDTFLLSGASGVGARSFYSPPKAFGNRADGHVPGQKVTDPVVNFAVPPTRPPGTGSRRTTCSPARTLGGSRCASTNRRTSTCRSSAGCRPSRRSPSRR